jgi:predicted membrane channel-forming protein YqfA (hemolysin III family)
MQDRRVDLGSCPSRACLPGTTRLVRSEPRSVERMLRIQSQHSFAHHRIPFVCVATLSLSRHGLQRDRPSSARRRCLIHLVLPRSGSLFRMFCMVCVCVVSQLNWTPADFPTCSCHIVWNLSAPAASFSNRLDFSGIVLLMWGASMPSIHYVFVCNTVLEHLHCSLATQFAPITGKVPADTELVQVTISAFGCVVFTPHPQFLGPVFRKYRALMYASFGLSGLLFVSHSVFLYGFAVQKRRLALEWMILMGALNIIGAYFYASRVRYFYCNINIDWKLTSLSYQRDGFRIASTLSGQVIRSFTCLSSQRLLYIVKHWSAPFVSHETVGPVASLAIFWRPENCHENQAKFRHH